MGTKYSKGDVVIKRKYKDLNAMQMDRKGVKSYDVIKVKDADSRSPTYVLRTRGGAPKEREIIERKASDLKKMF